MKAPRYVDLAALPSHRGYGPGHQRSLEAVILQARPSIEALAPAGMRSASNSMGFVMADPELSTQYGRVWDDQKSLGWLSGGWGNWRPLVANALRMMRPAARKSRNSLALCMDTRDQFRDIVEVQERDGLYLWGDLPKGGAVLHKYGNRQLLAAADGFNSPEMNEVVASMLAGLVYAEMARIDRLHQA